MEVLLFGGTTEGRLLAEWLDARGTCTVVACTATNYGAELLPHGMHVQALVGPLTSEDKTRLMEAHDFTCVIDATHPFAQHISASIDELARAYGRDVVRVIREEGGALPACEEDAALSTCEEDVSLPTIKGAKTLPTGTEVTSIEEATAAEEATSGSTAATNALSPAKRPSQWTVVSNAKQAAYHVAMTTNNVLLTTGSKDLPTFVRAMHDYKRRLYVRVLPTKESIARVLGLGIPPSHVIAMQGPFSTQLNRALIREFNIGCMVTKESGTTGGFGQKVEAARLCNVELVVIRRPRQHDGVGLKETKRLLEERYGL